MLVRLLVCGVASVTVIGSLFGASSAEAGPALDKISERGELAVCSKVDYRPFGYRETDGTPIGLEHDLISDVQARLEEKLGKEISVDRIPVIAANRIQFLEGGKCDLLIATMTDKPERRRTIDIVEPNYYSSGVNIMALKTVKIDEWDDINGQRLCSSQGAFWNKDLQRKHNLDLLTFAGIAETEQALRDGRCVGLLTDDSLATSRLKDADRWGDFELKVDTIMDASWGAAIQKGDQEFYEFMSETIANWHRSGMLVELEEKWGIKPTPWAARMHEKYENM